MVIKWSVGKMVVNFFKQNKKIIFLSILFVETFQFAYSANVNVSSNGPIISVEQDPQSSKLLFDISSNLKDEQYTQSIAYLSNDKLRNGVSKEYEYQKKFKDLGKDAFSKFVVDPISKEVELRDDYYVFYHGQKRDFLFIQDLYSRLSELFRKKALKDFVMLRLPENDHKKFKNVKQFLNEYKEEMENFWGWFDGQNHISKILLAVNPFLFGNTTNIFGLECTFQYFLDSRSISYVDIANLARDVFRNFGVLYDKYDTQIIELINCLSLYETNKTGLLLQIFVPKEIVNNVSYRCIPGGMLYDKSAKQKTSEDLSKYQTSSKNGLLDKYLLDPSKAFKFYTKYYSVFGFYASYGIPLALASRLMDNVSYKLSGNKLIYCFIGQSLDYVSSKFFDISHDAFEKCINKLPYKKDMDSMQFRILLTEDIMLNPDSGVKIFRYCNETEAVKEYKTKFNHLIDDIKRDYGF
ncbi:MAG: hypothetical protein ABIA74_04365 [bacterium]